MFRHLLLMNRLRREEDEVMKDVPGWVTGTYFGEPTYFTTAGGWWSPAHVEVSARTYIV